MKLLKISLSIIFIANLSACFDFATSDSEPYNIDDRYSIPDDQKLTDKQSNANNPLVLIKTNYGDIVLELFQDKAPVTVENFLKYVDEGYYNKTLFHRVREKFMIQGGGYTYDLKEKEKRDPIKNEASNGLKNNIYTLAMARTDDPNSAQAQFYINTVNNPNLDFQTLSSTGIGYCVFGKVIKGFQTVDKIGSLKCRKSDLNIGEKSFPVKPVKIISVTRTKKVSNN